MLLVFCFVCWRYYCLNEHSKGSFPHIQRPTCPDSDSKKASSFQKKVKEPRHAKRWCHPISSFHNIPALLKYPSYFPCNFSHWSLRRQSILHVSLDSWHCHSYFLRRRYRVLHVRGIWRVQLYLNNCLLIVNLYTILIFGTFIFWEWEKW